MREHPEFAALLDHVAGREDAQIVTHLDGCSACAAAAQKASRLLEAGRRAMAEPKPSRRALRLAMKAFGTGVTGKEPSLLRLVFDSFLKPATAEAIRAGALTARFLRFSGDVTVEMEVREGARGAELRGQLTPAAYAKEITLVAGKVRRRARVEPDGTFVLRGVPRKAVELQIGAARIQTDL